jgi:hypothetical protein
MAHYRTTVSSPADPGQVYAFLADFASIADWDPGVSAASLIAGTTGQTGARYHLTTSNLGFSLPLEYEILEAVAPADGFPGRVVLEAETRDLRSYDVITVTPSPTGCDVTYDADLALKGIWRPFDPALRVAFRVIADRAGAGLETAVQMRTLS